MAVPDRAPEGVASLADGVRPERRSVRSVERALDLLTAFSARHHRLQLRDLADVVGLPKASTHRLAASLVGRGFLRQDADGAYSLGSRLLELGGLVSNTAALAQLTSGAVAELSRLTGETVLVAEMDWMDRTCLITHKRDAQHPLAVTSPVGRRSGLGSGCIGKAVLGALDPSEVDVIVPRLTLVPRTRRSILDPQVLRDEVATVASRGYAVEINEFIEGVAGVAAAVCVGSGRPLGAVAIIAPSSRAPKRRLDQLGRLLCRTLAANGPAPQEHAAES
jgi:DNA-binding IclR family transcriptional regulator